MLLVLGILICAFVAGTLLGDTPVATFGALLLLAVAAGLALFLGNTPKLRDDSSIGNREVLQLARVRARVLSEMANTLGASLNYSEVLEAALDVGVLGLREVSRETRMTSMVLLFESNILKVVAARGLPSRDVAMTVEGRSGLLAKAFEESGPVFASKCADDPELSYFSAFQELRSVLIVPLRSGFQNFGVLVYGTLYSDAFSSEYVEVLAAIGTQATIALQNAVLYQNLRDEKERLVEVEEEARKKLARDLHDGPTQVISAMSMRIGHVRGLIEKSAPPTNITAELDKIEEMANKTTKEIRSMLFTLRPLVLETQGLSAALNQLKQKMKDTHGLDVILQLQAGVDELIEPKSQGSLFYIIEEAVNNARKYAQAGHIYVRLYRLETQLMIEVQDDGVGFNVESVSSNYDQRGSFGMVNMHERAELAGGMLRLDSAKGKGTKVSVVIQLKTYLQTRQPTEPRPGQTPKSGTPTIPPKRSPDNGPR